jgi:hypothetical protein
MLAGEPTIAATLGAGRDRSHPSWKAIRLLDLGSGDTHPAHRLVQNRFALISQQKVRLRQKLIRQSPF